MSKNAVYDLVAPAFTAAGAGKTKDAVVRVTRAAESDRGESTLAFIASTGRRDRFGESVDPEGWELGEFRKNPIFLNGHRFSGASSVLGRVVECDVRDVAVGGLATPVRALFIRVDFAVKANPSARLAYEMYKGGYLSAVSVGFRPLASKEVPTQDGLMVVYTRAELLEVSAVGVPANPDCVILPGA